MSNKIKNVYFFVMVKQYYFRTIMDWPKSKFNLVYKTGPDSLFPSLRMFQDKENAPESGKKVRKLRRETESTGNSKFYPSAQLSQASSQESLSVDRSFSSTNGIIPTNEAAEEYFLGPADRTQTPPPLPPKPKHLPTATSWPSQNQPCRVRRTVYLDQPSSSFV